MNLLLLPIGLLMACMVAFEPVQSQDRSEQTVDVAGYLRLQADNLGSFHIVVNHDYDRALERRDGDTLKLPTGRHHIRFVKRNHADQTMMTDIQPGRITTWRIPVLRLSTQEQLETLSSYPRIYWGSPVMLVTEPDAMLLVDGVDLGTSHMGVEPGGTRSYSARFHGKTHKPLFIGTDPNRPFVVHHLAFRPDRLKSYAWSALPGAAQFYKDQFMKGAVIVGLSAMGTAAALTFNHQADLSYDRYERTYRQYLIATTIEDAFRLGNNADLQLTRSQDMARYRNHAIAAIAFVYVLNIVDAFIPPNTGFRDADAWFNPYLITDDDLPRPGVTVSVKF